MATAWSAFESTGTGIVWPWMTTVPLFVPNAIVETVTPSATASAVAWSFGRPTVVLPSDRSTIAPARRIDDAATDGEADAPGVTVPGDAIGVAVGSWSSEA